MAVSSSDPFGQLLREWRGQRGLSQLDLAHEAEVSPRHLSFLETGRSRPSRKMVLRLGASLELPLRERNALLVAAGFAPLFRERRLGSEELDPVRRALERVLAAHDPYPAFVVDRAWNVLLGNAAHERSLAELRDAGLPIGEPVNVVRLVLSSELLRPRLVNWPEVARVLIRRIRRELRRPDPDARLIELHRELIEDPELAAAAASGPVAPESSILIPMVFEQDGKRLSWFTTLATIGTPLDVTLEELRIELLFPADDQTAAAAHAAARATPSRAAARSGSCPGP